MHPLPSSDLVLAALNPLTLILISQRLATAGRAPVFPEVEVVITIVESTMGMNVLLTE
jgi:hypothetical protein